MSYYECVQNVVDYIEANLTDLLDLKEVAQTANCSLYHFHRIFQATAGNSLKEYIRKRRLAEAARELRYTKKRILEIALDFGYESHEAFTRAFQRETGRTPGDFRKTRSSFRSFPKLNIKFTYNKGEMNMVKPKIVEKAEFMVIGPAIRTTIENEEGLKRIPKFWGECYERNLFQFIPNQKNNNTCYGICLDVKGNEFTYMIGVEVNSLEQIPEDMIGRKIPKAYYAVFTAKGPVTQSVQDLTRHIYKDWIFNSGYTLADSPDFELYDERCDNTDSSEVDIYVPIKKDIQDWRQYYASQGIITDPAEYKTLFDTLPDDIPSLCGIVQGLMFHIHWADRYGVNLSEERRNEANLRKVCRQLARIIKLDDSRLTVTRSLGTKLVGNCRDFSVLLCAMLRHKGIPARARCGFATYFTPGHYEDHWVCQYWNFDKERWVMVDVQLDDFQRRILDIDFNTYDIPEDRFLPAGKAWLMCRAGKSDPGLYGIFDMHGMWFIGGNLVRDLLSLNKTEILPWDVWGLMSGPDEEIPAQDMDLLDRVAKATCGINPEFSAIRSMYDNEERLGVPSDWEP